MDKKVYKCVNCKGSGLINLGDYIPIPKKLGLQRRCEYCEGWGVTTSPWIGIFAPNKFTNRKFIYSKLDYILSNIEPNYFGICSYSSPSDKVIIDYLYDKHIKFIVIDKEYHIYRKNAGPIRDKKVCNLIQKLLVFNNNDYNINNLLKEARKKSIDIKIVNTSGVSYEDKKVY